MPNIIDLLLQDHRDVEQLFARFNESNEGAVAASICRALAAHSEAEEHIVYPALNDVGPSEAGDGGEPSGAADELYEEQAHLKALVSRALQSEGRGLVDLMAEIERNLTEHVDDEETNHFPRLASSLPPAQLDVLGSMYLQVKQRVG